MGGCAGSGAVPRALVLQLRASASQQVFLKPGTRDPTSAKCYIVQALISPGVNHHQLIADLRGASASSLQEASRQPPRPAEPHFIATSEDLTLEMVDEFLKRTLAHHGS